MADKSHDGMVETENGSVDEVSATDETEIARLHPRTELHEIASATIYPKDGETDKPVRCSVLTRDLSLAGFGIALTRRVNPKQKITLDVQSEHYVGEVMWCREAPFGFYIAGCRLVDVP